jgi:hypothetical protein
MHFIEIQIYMVSPNYLFCYYIYIYFYCYFSLHVTIALNSFSFSCFARSLLLIFFYDYFSIIISIIIIISSSSAFIAARQLQIKLTVLVSYDKLTYFSNYLTHYYNLFEIKIKLILRIIKWYNNNNRFIGLSWGFKCSNVVLSFISFIEIQRKLWIILQLVDWK